MVEAGEAVLINATEGAGTKTEGAGGICTGSVTGSSMGATTSDVVSIIEADLAPAIINNLETEILD